jgi:AsmA-like protein
LTQAALVVGALLLVVLSLPIALAPQVKKRLLAAVGERFESQVEVATLSVSVLPLPRLSGTGLVLRHKHRTDVPPLVKVASFSADASVFGLFFRPMRLRRVHLEGLEINVPPGGMHINSDPPGAPTPSSSSSSSSASSSGGTRRSPIVIGELLSDGAILHLLRRTPAKAPRVFTIRQLAMRDVGADTPWPFRAELTNPTPPGTIHTNGTFGPWNADDPSNTSLAGEYRFSEANLGVFDGIQGILDSTGSFKGVLERIDVNGRATVPDFALSGVKHPVPLETVFHSIVDGTSGNTLLQPVDATLLKTKIHATGGVVEREGEKGRTIQLDVAMNDAHLEDVLRLAVKSPEPPMTGALKLTAALLIPPGDRDAVDKLRLDGDFEVAAARFTKTKVQAKVDEFSTKARGVSDDTPDPVLSNFQGKFAMRDGVIHFSRISFAMPGARVDVAGRYTMKTEALDFSGTVKLNAKLSKLTTGMKSFFLQLIDGLVRHDDITVIPITVSGTVGEPKVRLDVRKVFKSG